MITYTFQPDLSLIEVKGHGVISVEDIQGFYEELFQNEHLPGKIKVLIDGRDTAFAPGSESQMQRFGEVIAQLGARFSSMKEALLVDAPLSTAIASLYKLHTDHIRFYTFSVFSTEHAARNWLETA